MTKPLAGVDVNGVVFDHIAKATALMHFMRTEGITIPPYRFGPKQQVIDEFGITADIYEKAMKCLYENPKWFARFSQLTPGAAGCIRSLAIKGFDVVLVSSCRGLNHWWAQEVINAFSLPIAEFIPVEGSKTDFYAHCDIVLDDDANHLTPLLDYTTITPILMLPAPGGTGCEVISAPSGLDPRIRPCRGWSEAYKYISDITALAA